MKEKTNFKLIGLSSGNRCTLEYGNQDWFHAPTTLSPDRFKALFDYFKQFKYSTAWTGKEIAVVEHDGFYPSGKPKNAVVVEVILP